MLQFVCRMWNAPSSHVNIFFAAAICDSNRQLRDVCLYCKPSHGEVCSFLLSMVYKTYARNTMVFFFSCSFLVNGKGVERRTNVSLVCRFFFSLHWLGIANNIIQINFYYFHMQDTGPQFPTDISKMLKYGTNMIQAVGYFVGLYVLRQKLFWFSLLKWNFLLSTLMKCLLTWIFR